MAWVAEAQTGDYLIFFTDKNGTPFSTSQPGQFLSQRALDRRQRQGIAVIDRDLPVSPAYVQQVANTGARIRYRTKWLNGVIVRCTQAQYNQILTLPFVTNTQYLGLGAKNKAPREFLDYGRNVASTQQIQQILTLNYGNSFNQVRMVGADSAHILGFEGQGMHIAVFDGGFANARTARALQNLWNERRILGHYDFVNDDTTLYTAIAHGTEALSCIGAEADNLMYGTAYKASFYLFATEEPSQEREIECAQWLIAAERSDSLGVDVINSSLGYSTFDIPSQNYTPSMLDGNTVIASIAARILAETGVLVVVSAGNEGNNGAWEGRITSPSDPANVLAIGAVNSMGSLASFSSRGPSGDGRIKPDIVAQGSGATVATLNGVGLRNGTSFSGPIAAGLAAVLWQANPTRTAGEIRDALRMTASNAATPNNNIGYGIPNFLAAHRYLQTLSVAPTSALRFRRTLLFPNPVGPQGGLQIQMPEAQWLGSQAEWQILDLQGKIIAQGTINPTETQQDLGLNPLPSGAYQLVLKGTKKTELLRFLVQ